MNNKEAGRFALWFSLPMAVLVAIASTAGISIPAVYANETRISAAEFAGVDVFNLVAAVPALLISAELFRRGSLAGRLVWTGTVMYVVYAYIFYTLDVHFNALFLVYCALWGLSFYTLLWSLPSLAVPEIARLYGPGAPRRATAALFFWIALSVGARWMIEYIPAIGSGRVPHSLVELGSFTDPAAVLDLSLLLPALVIAAIMILRRRPLGFVLGPVLLTFAVLVFVMLDFLLGCLNLRGLGPGYAPLVISSVQAAAGMALLAVFFR